MPVRSKAQGRMMEGAAHNAEFAAKVGVPQSVAKEYVERMGSIKGMPEHVPSHASHDHKHIVGALKRAGIKR